MSTMSEQNGNSTVDYEVVVVGGGPAGLTTALYTTRLGHETLIVDKGGGRCAMMAETHNVIGIPESTSGGELLQTALEQVQSYGADHKRGAVTDITKQEGDSISFTVEIADEIISAERVVLATGFSDVTPPSPLPRTARGLHYCLHCDAYMFRDEPVYVMGHSESAAHVAMIMLNFTDEVDLLLRGAEPEWSAETDTQLKHHPIEIISKEVTGVTNGDDGWLESLEFADGTSRSYTGGFAMYGSTYNSELAESLGCTLNDDGSIAVNDHGETSVAGVYAVGDVTPGHNQIPVRMGQGAKAGIDLHYTLRTYPKSLDQLQETTKQ